MKTPNASLNRLSTVPTRYSAGGPALKVCGGSNSTLGKGKRVVATAPAPQAAANAVHATPIVVRNPRRLTPAAGTPAAAAGLASGAGEAAGPGAAGDGAPAGGVSLGVSVIDRPRS